MKWAKVIPSASSKSNDADDEACYNFYTPQQIDKVFRAHKENIWAVHEFEFDFECKEEYEKFQKRYETFVGGYLYYYDRVTRSNAIDHTLYFRWKPFNEKGRYSVTLYLSPAPLRARALGIAGDSAGAIYNGPLPKNPGGKASLIKKSAAKLTPKSNGTGQAIVLNEQHAEVAMFDSTSGGFDNAIDPPPPPVPPPPPRE